MLVDANILLYAVDDRSHHHPTATAWMDEQLNGSRPVGLPWASLGAFLRVITNRRIAEDPLSAEQAWGHVSDWLASDVAWVPAPTARHAEVLGDLVIRHRITGDLVPDAQLAALAIEHGLTVYSADSDFARWPTVSWVDPLH